MYQAIRELSKKAVTWAAQVELQEEEELARQRAERQREAAQESAQPLAGEELVAGVYYNDESHDVEVGSDRDLSDGERGINSVEVEGVALMREVRAVRRKTPRQTKVGRIRRANRSQPLAEYVADILVAMIEQLTYPMAIRADIRAYTQKLQCEPDLRGTTERCFSSSFKTCAP